VLGRGNPSLTRPGNRLNTFDLWSGCLCYTTGRPAKGTGSVSERISNTPITSQLRGRSQIGVWWNWRCPIPSLGPTVQACLIVQACI